MAQEEFPLTRLSEDRRDYLCVVDGAVIPGGSSVVGTVRDGKVVGVSVWAEGMVDKSGTRGMLCIHACGDDPPSMPDDVAQHHATLGGLGRTWQG